MNYEESHEFSENMIRGLHHILYLLHRTFDEFCQFFYDQTGGCGELIYSEEYGYRFSIQLDFTSLCSLLIHFVSSRYDS